MDKGLSFKKRIFRVAQILVTCDNGLSLSRGTPQVRPQAVLPTIRNFYGNLRNFSSFSQEVRFPEKNQRGLETSIISGVSV